MDGAQVPGQNAKISFSGDKMNVTPSVDGSIIDWEKTMKDFDKRVKGDERTWDADYKPDPAEYTTEMAERPPSTTPCRSSPPAAFLAHRARTSAAWRRRSTALWSPQARPSPQRLHRPARHGAGLRGVRHHHQRPLRHRSGRRHRSSPPRSTMPLTSPDFEDVAHTPHSYYISRYPVDREAAVYEGSIDLQFKNTTNTPVRIETSFGGGKITVRFKGVKTYNVESVNNGRWATTQPTRMSVGEDCSPSSGAPGFTTSDTRIIKDLSGREISRETTTTVYDPQPIVSCG